VDFQLKSGMNGCVKLRDSEERSVRADLDLTEVPIRRYRGMQLSQLVVGDSRPGSELRIK
jgi:hypothetical protein